MHQNNLTQAEEGFIDQHNFNQNNSFIPQEYNHNSRNSQIPLIIEDSMHSPGRNSNSLNRANSRFLPSSFEMPRMHNSVESMGNLHTGSIATHIEAGPFLSQNPTVPNLLSANNQYESKALNRHIVNDNGTVFS